jgi:hypothetical protein
MTRYVISHTGKKGGPWEADVGTDLGEPTSDPQKRWAKPFRNIANEICARLRTQGHPSAKVFRLVRRAKVPTLTPLERAVVEAALAYEAETDPGKAGELCADLQHATRALRAKQGG